MATMIRIEINTAADRWDTVVNSDTTVKAVLEAESVRYDNCVVHLNGMPLTSNELNKTFEAHNITDACTLSAIVKARNA